jgi:hypothetical protein
VAKTFPRRRQLQAANSTVFQSMPTSLVLKTGPCSPLTEACGVLEPKLEGSLLVPKYQKPGVRRSASSVLTPRRNAVPARPICTSLTEVTVRWAEARRPDRFQAEAFPR